MIAALVVAGALILASGATALAHRSDRRAHATIASYWASFWEGAEELSVTVVGAASEPIALGRVTDSDPLQLESDNFALRADNGQTLQVPAGNRVTLYADTAQIVAGRVEIPAGTRLAARVQRPPDRDGPFRGDGRTWTIPEDIGLLLSDQKISQIPFAWAERRIRWSRLVAFWLLGGGLAAAAIAVPRLMSFALLYAIALAADAVFLRGAGVFWYATTERVIDLDEAIESKKL